MKEPSLTGAECDEGSRASLPAHSSWSWPQGCRRISPTWKMRQWLGSQDHPSLSPPGCSPSHRRRLKWVLMGTLWGWVLCSQRPNWGQSRRSHTQWGRGSEPHSGWGRPHLWNSRAKWRKNESSLTGPVSWHPRRRCPVWSRSAYPNPRSCCPLLSWWSWWSPCSQGRWWSPGRRHASHNPAWSSA